MFIVTDLASNFEMLFIDLSFAEIINQKVSEYDQEIPQSNTAQIILSDIYQTLFFTQTFKNLFKSKRLSNVLI